MQIPRKRNRYGKNARIIHLQIKYTDGISIVYEDFWFNVRPSNTEPLLRITMEAKEKSVLDARLREVGDLIKVI